jgi:hypothetical protein
MIDPPLENRSRLDKGGANYISGNSDPRGIYVYVRPALVLMRRAAASTADLRARRTSCQSDSSAALDSAVRAAANAALSASCASMLEPANAAIPAACVARTA